AVALTRRVKKSSAAGLVNAVLRAVSRNKHRLPLPARDDVRAFLETALSHPGWLAERWLARYGAAAAEAWEAFDNAPAPLTIRINPLKANQGEAIAALAAHG